MRSVCNIFIFSIFFSLLWMLLVCAQVGTPTKSSANAFGLYSLKEAHGLGIDDKKIVVVSGSNSYIGIDSKMIKDRLGIDVVNDATHAGLGMRYLLYKSQQVLKAGDIAILPLEYNFYYMGGKPYTQYMDYILSRDAVHFFNLPIKEMLQVFYYVKYSRIYDGFVSYFREDSVYENKGNVHGDAKKFEGELADYQVNLIATLASRPDSIASTDLSAEFIKCMDNYIDWAKKNKITLVYMPPNHMYNSYYDSPKYILFLNNIRRYYEERNVLFVGEPRNYMYDSSYYIDSTYHLNGLGVEKRTDQLINDLNDSLELRNIL